MTPAEPTPIRRGRTAIIGTAPVALAGTALAAAGPIKGATYSGRLKPAQGRADQWRQVHRDRNRDGREALRRGPHGHRYGERQVRSPAAR